MANNNVHLHLTRKYALDIVVSHPVLEDTGMVIGNRGGEVGCIEFALF